MAVKRLTKWIEGEGSRGARVGCSQGSDAGDNFLKIARLTAGFFMSYDMRYIS
jgi:hypothetical protein